MNRSLAALSVLVAVAPLAAQDAPQGKAVGTFTPKSCGEPGQQLERNFDVTIPGRKDPISFVYASCDQAGRNDYLSGYTERHYKGSDDYGLTIITEHGDGAVPSDPTASEILVSKGKDWIAKSGGLVSNDLIAISFRIEMGPTTAVIRTPAPATKVPPPLPRCEANLPKPVYGPNTLWLVTKTKAYYYREDCDICAELDSCDLKTGRIKEEIVAHSVSCSELDRFKVGEETVYQNCPR